MLTAIKFLKKYWLYCILIVAIFGAYVYGSSSGYNKADTEWRLSTSETDRARAEKYNNELTKVIQDIASEQRRANDITSTMLEAQKEVLSNSQNLKSEVKNAVKKNQDSGDSCPAFDDSSLQLYKRALGY